MLEKTKELLEALTDVCDNYEKYHMPLRTDIYERLSEIQWFIEQILRMFADAEMQQEIMEILQDMLTALEQEDEVLLYDALQFGLLEYMRAVVEILGEE